MVLFAYYNRGGVHTREGKDWRYIVLPRSIEDGVFSPGLVCLHYPGLDPRVCLGCPVFLNGDEIPGSSLLTGPLNLKAQSLITQSSTAVLTEATLYMQVAYTSRCDWSLWETRTHLLVNEEGRASFVMLQYVGFHDKRSIVRDEGLECTGCGNGGEVE